jgi:hypothetical protein
MLLGSVWRLNEYYMWMSLGEYSVVTADPFLEKRFWSVFPEECLRFWPLLPGKLEKVASFFEKALPVTVRTRMTGLGRFSTSMDLLSPWLSIEWDDQIWCVSREGRMWNTSDEDMKLTGLKIPQKPLWRVASSDVSEAARAPLPRGVFPSFFPLETIRGFLEGFEKASWFANVEEIVLEHRGGAVLFRVRYVREKRRFTILIQADRSGWQELNRALEHILERLLQEGGNHLIDATYRDRIVVRSLSAGAGEGS